jgi:photosystem II stability/assembly factor-like uncharacterized protein
MMKNLALIFTFLLVLCKLNAQTEYGNRISSYNIIKEKKHVLNSISFKNIGPTVMSGRITSIAVNPNNPIEFYAAYASGGVFYTNNNGMSFKPIFDKEASITIGAIAVQWSPRIIYVGTGECNSSRSSYAGTGVYKSIDSGYTWQHLGLENTQHISKVLLHPSNKNIIYVSSIGPLYSTNDNSTGIFKSTDAGKSWQQLALNSNNAPTGVIDLCFDNFNTNKLYACTWERSRTAWQFNGSGNNSAIYSSENEGVTWQCLSGGNSGFPKNEGVGRIGIAQSYNNPKILYALLDNQNRQAATEKQKNELNALTIQSMTKQQFLATDNKKIDDFLSNNDYPKKYSAKSLKQDVTDNKLSPKQIADWKLSDGDAALFQTPVIGAELYKSIDGGTTWSKTHSKLLQGLYFTYGYYFGNIILSPNNDNELYVLGFTTLYSKDGGKTFTEIYKENTHPDVHALWINKNNSNHLITGNDGGINISYDNGNNWYKANTPSVAQCYAVEVDNASPYNVYCGLQDNGTWVGNSTAEINNEWHSSGHNNFKELNGGDGMQIRVDSRDNNTVYTGYQFGYYQRSTVKENGGILPIHPTYDIGQDALRYNWQTPIWLSKHNEDILYMGSNCFHRSMNKGAKMTKLSEPLSTTKLKGNVPFGTITTLHESPLQFGLIYCGTDDGNIWVSTDVGNSFKKININTKQFWTSCVLASKYNLSTIYASQNAYRQDDFSPMLYSSNNFGSTWKAIGNNLPQEPINVIEEDPKDSNIIYVGTDNGLYVSFNKGLDFEYWASNLPRVAIHDIAIQAKENDIVLGTHGRGIFIANLSQVQKISQLQKDTFLLLYIDTITAKDNWGSSWASYQKANEPEININYYTKLTDSCIINIYTADQKTLLFTHKQKPQFGFNTFAYNASINKQVPKKSNISYKGDNDVLYLKQGLYWLEIKQGAYIRKTNWLIK